MINDIIIAQLRASLVQQLEDAEVEMAALEVEVEFEPSDPRYLLFQAQNDHRNALAQQINEIDGAETYEISNLLWYL